MAVFQRELNGRVVVVESVVEIYEGVYVAGPEDENIIDVSQVYHWFCGAFVNLSSSQSHLFGVYRPTTFRELNHNREQSCTAWGMD